METEVLAAAGATAGHVDFSLTALFLRATITVKIVMIMLVVASFWSWAIIIDKLVAFRKLGRETKMFEEAFWSGQPLDQLYDRVSKSPRSAIEKVFVAGMVEFRRSFARSGQMTAGATQRIERFEQCHARRGVGQRSFHLRAPRTDSRGDQREGIRRLDPFAGRLRARVGEV